VVVPNLGVAEQLRPVTSDRIAFFNDTATTLKEYTKQQVALAGGSGVNVVENEFVAYYAYVTAGPDNVPPGKSFSCAFYALWFEIL
jgi:hypothetical protein